MLKPLNIPLEEFLRPFFEPGETICLRVFDDRKSGIFKGQKFETTLTQINKLAGTLKEHNDQNRGVFFVVNYGGHDDENITRVNAQFVECDDLSFEDQMDQINAFPIEPSLIVKTQKSLHVYWLMKNSDITNFERVQKRLIAHFTGDKMCVNKSRVMRIPGFFHCKGKPVMVECVKFNPELKYTQTELEAVLPEIEDNSDRVNTPMQKGSRKGLNLVAQRCDFIKHCKDNAKVLSEHDWYAMITNLAVFEGGDVIIHELSKEYPGYNQQETTNKIQHFLSSGTKPITCTTIAEKGFKCPRINDESCGCRAPAALCYKVLGVEDLRGLLQETEVKQVPLDDIKTAQDFVNDYLYNVDPTIAETFINYEIRAHFGLKAVDLKPLISFYKDLYKKYSMSKETRRETSEVNLPEWYEVNEHGGLKFISGLLADHMAKNVDAFYGAGSYFHYQQGVYHSFEDLWAYAKVREFMISRYATMAFINDTAGQWKMLIRKEIREINCNPFIINLRNGLYNMLDDTFNEHTSKYYSTVQINASYLQGETCPKFMVFLKSILHDEEIYLLQEIIGYFIIPVNKAQKSFVFVGAPNAGKSTLLSVVQEVLLGSENVSNIAWQNLGDRFNKAELFGKLANIFADLPTKSIEDNNMFKALTGEDYITAERKSKDPFSFKPYARLLFSCNDIPRNYGDKSEGFYRRLIIIRFNRSVPENERDPNLRESLSVERDGILMWSLIGLKRLIENNYKFSETERTKAELKRYRIENNSVLSFIDEFCEIDDEGESLREELYTRYKEFCHGAGLKPFSQKNFNKEIEVGCETVKKSRDRVSKRRIWKGITYLADGKEKD